MSVPLDCDVIRENILTIAPLRLGVITLFLIVLRDHCVIR